MLNYDVVRRVGVQVLDNPIYRKPVSGVVINYLVVDIDELD